MDTTTQRTVEIDGRQITLRATARTPRLYRQTFGRDMMQDMAKLRDAYNARVKDGVDLSMVDLEIFENLAYIMAKQADPSIPDSPDDWLDTFGMFSIYEIFPDMLKLWKSSVQTLSEPKKK